MHVMTMCVMRGKRLKRNMMHTLGDVGGNLDGEKWIQYVEGTFVKARKHVLAFRAKSEEDREEDREDRGDMCVSLESLHLEHNLRP